jgi:hypothetical protein
MGTGLQLVVRTDNNEPWQVCIMPWCLCKGRKALHLRLEPRGPVKCRLTRGTAADVQQRDCAPLCIVTSYTSIEKCFRPVGLASQFGQSTDADL